MNKFVQSLDPKLRRIAVFGAGVSGQAAVQLVEAIGAEAELFDEQGHVFSEADCGGYDAFIFSPGFAGQHPWRRQCVNSGKPCYSELGFAAQFWSGKMLGVTGTNGKTTVTELICDALNRAGQSAVTAGNIGAPLSERMLHAEATWAVCEISSFQSELPQALELDGLIWTNFAEDHLDRYSDMTEYFDAKANLLNCVKTDAPVVLGDSVYDWIEVAQHRPRCVLLSSRVRCEDAPALPEPSPFSFSPQSENFQLATQLWRALELPDSALVEAATEFQLAPHRLAKITQWQGVSFWNDSKATNFHAALAAAKSMQEPIYWIGGGSGKGGALAEFARSMSDQIEAAFVYGDVANELAAALEKYLPRVQSSPRFEDAVRGASRAALAASPAVVLLSPGFASFDQFQSYAERGESFISAVLSLKDSYSAN